MRVVMESVHRENWDNGRNDPMPHDESTERGRSASFPPYQSQ